MRLNECEIPKTIRNMLIEFKKDNYGFAIYLAYTFADGTKFCHECGKASITDFEQFQDDGGKIVHFVKGSIMKFETLNKTCDICAQCLFEFIKYRAFKS